MAFPLPVPHHSRSAEQLLIAEVESAFDSPDDYTPRTIEEAVTNIINSGHQQIIDYCGYPVVQASVALELALENYPRLFMEELCQ